MRSEMSVQKYSIASKDYVWTVSTQVDVIQKSVVSNIADWAEGTESISMMEEWLRIASYLRKARSAADCHSNHQISCSQFKDALKFIP